MEKISPKGKVIYQDNFQDLANWHAEGLVHGVSLLKPGVMRLDCTGSEQGEIGCMAFCKTDFPDNICLEYNIYVEEKNGLAITFLAMQGLNGEDAIDGVPFRKGLFREYVGRKAATRSYHVSISRYNDKAQHTGVSNWRRNPGAHLMAQADDLCKEIQRPYRIAIIKKGPLLQLQVDDRFASGFDDPQDIEGDIPRKGKIGFRLIGAKAIARISNLKVTLVDPE